MAGDATRTAVDGVLEGVVDADGTPEHARAQQFVDGTVHVWAESEAGLARIRAVLPLENDHSEFLSRFADDPLIGEATRRLRGLRPLRLGSVAQALLRAVCGQLIQASRAAAIERAVIRARIAEPRTLLHARRRRRRSGASRRPSCARSGWAPAAARRSSASAARSTSKGCTTSRLRGSRRGSSANRGSGRGRSASSRSTVSGATSAAWRGTSASSSSPPCCGAATSRRRRRTRCSSRTANGPGSRASTC